jgi:hypothetical protein
MKLKPEVPVTVQRRRRMLLLVAAVALIALLITVPISQYQSAQRMEAKATMMATIGADYLGTVEPLPATPEN